MDEISNKTLATLLVVAIVISLAGTFFAMRGVSSVTKVTGLITNPSGTAQVYINQTISIKLNTAGVDFGSGYRNATFPDAIDCNLTSLESKPDCWVAFSSYAPQDFWLENDGNVQVNVTINSTKGENFFNTTCSISKVILAGTGAYKWNGKIRAIEPTAIFAGCNSTAGDLVTTRDLNLTTSNFAGTNELLCKNLSDNDLYDEFNITIRLDVPKGPSGNCSSTVTFTAAQNFVNP